ncbi:hypothetical protein LUD75_05400 [Epilithonimonas sp. JDS]|uniref:hypothetical protein n=1 Tax=Epilithonimonas sp. JDS TaxID=2902797 RepID=UPI001E62B1D2|nr:hypothetical protein [Epilithonimonas sp. JDS]MCD9854127.1 hypothetical protein [Epilithonimonas sp. JDS]
MEKALHYLKKNLLLVLLGTFFLGGFLYLTYSGNQLCDCATTEKYKDGASRGRSHGASFYRFYHK